MVLFFLFAKKIDALRSTLHPPITSQELKVSVEMDELLGQTVTAIIKISQHHPKVGATYTLSGKFGIDGSGAHKVRQQLVDSTNAAIETPHVDSTITTNYLLACYVPIELLDANDGDKVWINKVPNSFVNARPLFLIRGL